MSKIIEFGVAGNCDRFYAEGNKATLQMPGFLNKNGLDAYEVQFGRGVRMNDALAENLRKKAEEYNISLSVHAPYFISLSSVEEEKRDNSINYIVQSAVAADKLGAKRIVVHSGSCSKISREEALELAKGTIKKAVNTLDDMGLSHIILCPETMGKINQLGTLEEVIELCLVDERMIPTIDFGHLNARTLGSVKGYEDYKNILEKVEDKLGIDRMKIFHSHFSKIEWTENGGEKKHLTFEDEIYGPFFEPLGEYIYKRNLCPTIICESAGTQTDDALKMKTIYEGYKK